MRRYLLLIALVLASMISSRAQVGELPRSTPEAEGVDSTLLNHFYHKITTLPNVDIHHMMVLRHGKVIGEMHAFPYQAEHLHTLYSASKTVTALAVGLAVDDGLLSVDDKVSKYLRDKMPTALPPALDSLTVRNLLTMAAGREPDLSIPEGEVDWLTAWFAGDFAHVGKRFVYDSMCTHALATIVTRVTGKHLLDYVRERIFTPLHITVADWEMAPDSIEAAGWGLRLHTESEAKLGLLMLHEGKWDGKQLVSPQWIHDMTRHHLRTNDNHEPKLSFKGKIMKFLRTCWHALRAIFTGYNIDHYYLGYGYQTKAISHPRAEIYFAAGYGGQLIYVVPQCDLVIVINGRAGNYGDELNAIYDHFLVPLISGEKTGNDTWQPLRIEMPEGMASHPIEQRLLDGHTCLALDENLLGLQNIEVRRNGDDRIFTMTDQRGPLRAIAACGQWRITTSDERPIYIMESREQLVGTQRPFTSAAAYAWQGDTLVLRLDWLDGGDNRRLKMVFDDDQVTVMACDNFDPLLTDTIHGVIRNK